MSGAGLQEITKPGIRGNSSYHRQPFCTVPLYGTQRFLDEDFNQRLLEAGCQIFNWRSAFSFFVHISKVVEQRSFETTETEIEDSFNTDNSVAYEDSFNTDNRIDNDGDYAGNNGTINFVDAGSIDAARSIAMSALDANGGVIEHAFDFGVEALDEVQEVAVSAITNINEFGGNAIDSLTQQSSDFASNLADVSNASINSNQLILDNIAAKSSEDNAVIADLARSTSLAGQDIVAKSSERMVMYIAIAVGIGFIAMTLRGK